MQRMAGCNNRYRTQLGLVPVTHSVTLGRNHTITHHPQSSPEETCHGRANTEPAPANVTRRRHNNPPRVISQTGTPLESLVDPTNLPEPVHCRVNQTNRRRIDPPERAPHPPPTTDGTPDTHGAVDSNEAGDEDANIAKQGTESRMVPAAGGGEGS